MLKIGSVSRTKTFDHKPFEFKELESEMVDGKRFYNTPTGEKYPSVTTILSSFQKEGILEWRRRVGEEEANKITGIATRRGTKVHTMCERYILNEDNIGKGMMPSDIDMFKQIQPILDSTIDCVYASEIPLYSHTLRAAGRVDLICSYKGTKTVLDFKTSRKPKKEEWIDNYYLQATCYAMMLEEIYQIACPNIAIVIAVENDKPQIFERSSFDLRDEVKFKFSLYHENNS